jgi:phenylacetate-CoA ligase
MSGKVEELFLKSPYVVRLLGANFKSWQLNRLRRGGVDWEQIMAAHRFQRYFEMSTAQLEEAQTQLLAAFIDRARRYTPYYQEQDLPPVKSVGDLTRLPLLSKKQAREARERLLDTELINQPHYTGHTSGSTGTPFYFKLTLDALRTRFALRDNFYRFHGCDFSDTNIRLGGRLFVSVKQQKPPFWIFDYVTNQLMLSIYHMDDTALSSFMKVVEKYNPKFITGYPSAIYTLAKFCASHKIAYCPQFVFTDSETLLDNQREAIEQIWQCKVYDYYGMEAGWLAGECHQGKYHLNPLCNIIEILDEQGNPSPPGDVGEIVVTDLTNPLMPLIRYRTGDSAARSKTACDCGWHTPILDYVEGRMDDIITLPNGRKVGRLDHIFKMADHIRECQIIQETPSEFVFLLVPDQGYNAQDEQNVLREAYLRLGDDVHIELRVVDAIERTARGKFRSVISKVSGN